ncbi:MULTISPECIES: hypothetical protein [Pseudomonas]|uniref:Uncharacterized protein n=2 Tax=unclassified Pseudomonas TaxID=196821 RepID=A0AB39IAM6_9PSED|nr:MULTISPECIES: hypothetical protein [Pseudomonas]MDD1979643.1 hypothetical protein [Pseudomonas putida]MDH2558821.1 hypothetical protein [Pseudomonas sp. Hg5Tf]
MTSKKNGNGNLPQGTEKQDEKALSSGAKGHQSLHQSEEQDDNLGYTPDVNEKALESNRITFLAASNAERYSYERAPSPKRRNR